MLPAIRLSDPPDLDSHLAYKRREAVFKRLVSAEHKKWCLCGSAANHFIPSNLPLQTSESCGEDGGTASGEADIITEDSAADGGEDMAVAGGGEGYISDSSLNMCLEDIDILLLLAGNL